MSSEISVGKTSALSWWNWR